MGAVEVADATEGDFGPCIFVWISSTSCENYFVSSAIGSVAGGEVIRGVSGKKLSSEG